MQETENLIIPLYGLFLPDDSFNEDRYFLIFVCLHKKVISAKKISFKVVIRGKNVIPVLNEAEK